MSRIAFSLTALLVLFASVASFSQEKKLKVKFGKFSDSELAMQSYTDDPAAPAVVLFDKAEFTHRYSTSQGFIFNFERHVRIKVFKKDALNLADVIIFHLNDERITDLQASSFNMENGVLVETKIAKENIFDEKITRTRRLKKLTIPGVKEGSIIEFKYVRTNMSVDLPNWTFQYVDIPVVWSEYEASVPSFFEFSKMAQGEVPFSVATEELKNNTVTGMAYNSVEMHFVQEKIPALKPEPFMFSIRDYLSQINFDIRAVYRPEAQATGNGYGFRLINGAPMELNRSWEKLGEELLEDVYDAPLKPTKFSTEEAAKCTAGKTTTAEKVAAIYEFTGKNFQVQDIDWLGTTRSQEELIKNKKGTPTEVNLLFINMLRRANITAFPLVLSTREHGKVLPFRVTLDAFDRVITVVENDDKTLTLIDASAWPHPPGMLPVEDLNEEGLLLRAKDNISWLPLQNKTNSRSAIQMDAAIDATGKISGAINFSESGYGAVSTRIQMKSKDAATYVREKFATLLLEGEASDLKLENIDQWQEQGVKGIFNFNADGLASVSGNKIYVNPSLGLGLKENPFKNPERKFNIELGVPKSDVQSISLKIPDGYKVEEIPKGAKMTFGENALIFDYMPEVTPEGIRINIRRTIKNPYIGVEQYADLQQFYSNIVAKLEEQVVLTKL